MNRQSLKLLYILSECLETKATNNQGNGGGKEERQMSKFIDPAAVNHIGASIFTIDEPFLPKALKSV